MVSAVSLGSALPGAWRALLAFRAGMWSGSGDGVLFWLTWEGDPGFRRLGYTLVLAVLAWAVAGVAKHSGNRLARLYQWGVQLFARPAAAAACLFLALLPTLVVPLVRPDPAGRPDVVVVMMDTIRLDHVGWGGSELDTTPHLDSLAAQGVAFTQAISQAPWTKPATATLMTGTIPGRHRATDRLGPLRQKLRSLPEAFASAGYRTLGLSANPNITREFGFHQGFLDWEQYDAYERADTLLADAREWLAKSKRPSLVYLHLNDAHYPYDPPTSTRGLFNQTGIEAHLDGETERAFRESYGASFTAEQVESMRLSYAEEIRALDAALGPFLEERLDAGRETLVVVLSDHGEEFLDHGDLGHAHTLYEELLRIPLQFAWSPEFGAKHGLTPAVHDEQVRTMDVLPTVLEFAGLEWPDGAPPIAGKTLAPFLRGEGGEPRPASAETDHIGSVLSGPAGPLRAYRDGHGWKLIMTDPWLLPMTAGRYWVFDLDADPGEHRNLAGERADKRTELRAAFIGHDWLVEQVSRLTSVELGAHQEAMLAELGYAEQNAEELLEGEPYLDERAVMWWLDEAEAATANED